MNNKSITLFTMTHMSNRMISLEPSVLDFVEKHYNGTTKTFDKESLMLYVEFFVPSIINPRHMCTGNCTICVNRNNILRGSVWFTCAYLIYLHELILPNICSKRK